MYQKELIEYVQSITMKNGKMNMHRHTSNIQKNISEAILFESTYKKLNINCHILFRLVKENIEFPVRCKYCGKEIQLKTERTKSTILQYCSNRCVGLDKVEDKKKTRTENFGSLEESYKIAHEKRKNTFEEKYGSLEEAYQQQLKTRENTCLEKYGTKFAPNNQEKMKQSCLEKYGVEFYSQSDEFKRTTSEKAKIKREMKYWENLDLRPHELKQADTNIEKFGVKTPLMLDSVKQTTKLKNKVNYYKRLIKYLPSLNLEMIDDFETYSTNEYSKYRCTICGTEFRTNSFSIYKVRCPNCNKIKARSQHQDNISKWIESLGFEVENNKFSILKTKELDIYVPEKKLAIEYDGLYWHSNRFIIDPKTHLYKTLECKEKGIQLLHIYEDEWMEKTEIVKGIIKSKLDVFEKIINTSECTLKEVSENEYKEFLKENYIYGYRQAAIKLGLYKENELVFCVGIENEEIVVICSKLDVKIVDGLKPIIEKYEFKKLYMYIDLRFENDFKQLGFKRVSQLAPDYFFIVNKERLTRNEFQERQLNESEYDKIFDCGKIKMVNDINYVAS